MKSLLFVFLAVTQYLQFSRTKLSIYSSKPLKQFPALGLQASYPPCLRLHIFICFTHPPLNHLQKYFLSVLLFWMLLMWNSKGTRCPAFFLKSPQHKIPLAEAGHGSLPVACSRRPTSKASLSVWDLDVVKHVRYCGIRADTRSQTLLPSPGTTTSQLPIKCRKSATIKQAQPSSSLES